MTDTGVVLACLGLLVGLGGLERWRRDRDRRAVPIRIHVNGTRGKSTVTRLIAGALRAAGIAAIAKTTGTAPRLILADGTEREIRRRSPANIREQLWLLRVAARHGARAVVVECMAIDPALQWVSEHFMVGATIGVITNARSDHADLMGWSRRDVARALSATIPQRGILVLGEADSSGDITRQADALGTKIVDATALPIPGLQPPVAPWMLENIRMALAVTRVLNIPDGTAIAGMLAAAPDPGTAQAGRLSLGDRDLAYINAAAANDPESLQSLVEAQAGNPAARRVFVFNHRDDRPTRLAQFGNSGVWSRPGDLVVVTGNRPDAFTWRRLVLGGARDRVQYVPAARLASRLAASDRDDVVVFCGNTRGLSLSALARGERGSWSRQRWRSASR